MGLDVTFDAFNGAYSAFNRLRCFIAEGIGGSYPPHEDKTLLPDHWYWSDDGKFGAESHPGLHAFFAHSDCDGEIDPELCGRLADEFEEIMPLLEKLQFVKYPVAEGHLTRYGSYVNAVKNFQRGCREAHEAGEPLEFM